MNKGNEMTQEQYSDLTQYVPESDMVKVVFEDKVEHKIEDWAAEVTMMAEEALSGDVDALMNILELTYLNAHNEGMLANDEAVISAEHN